MTNNRILSQLIVLNQEKNFTRAAEKLCLSQPTLSRNIQALEKKMGHVIFDRSPKILHLTQFGEMIIRHAEKIVSGNLLLENEVAQFSNMKSGHLRFGLGPYPAEGTSGEVIAKFNEQYSNIHVKTVIDHWINLNTMLINEHIEFFIGEISELLDRDNLDVIPYKQHQAFLYCRPEHPLLKKKSVTYSECLEYSIAQPTAAKRLSKYINNDLLHPVKENQRADIKCDNISLAKQIVINSFALGLGTFSTIGECVKLGKVNIIPLAEKFISTNYGIVKIKNHTLSPAAQKAIDIYNVIEGQHCIAEEKFLAKYLYKDSNLYS